jgi:hypothetical protein
MTYNLYLLGLPPYFDPFLSKGYKSLLEKGALSPTVRQEKNRLMMNAFSLNKENNHKQNSLINSSNRGLKRSSILRKAKPFLRKTDAFQGLAWPLLAINSKKEKVFLKNKVVFFSLSGAPLSLKITQRAKGSYSSRSLVLKTSLSGNSSQFNQSGKPLLSSSFARTKQGLKEAELSLNKNLNKSETIDPLTNHFNRNTYWNQCFDKGRFKNFVLWFFLNNGEHKTVQLVEQFKTLGFEYATKAGISLGIEDLKIPPKKSFLIFEAEKETAQTVKQYQRGDITGVERFQRLIDTWHRTSEQLKQEVIDHFEATDILNPVYMMAFSGARGNISQVRQLVGMRGLMANPQGQIIDFPIRSNFREGLTLTEYIISSYGARKGIVDTALRTANAGYLTRRLVDVAQHVIISNFDCGTRRGIFLTDMKEGNKTIVSLQTRLVGRVCARDIFVNGEKIAKRNNEISIDLAFQINRLTKKVFVRSALTCETKKLVCQLCYGWSLAQGNLVSIGEAIGVIAAQSIGEPGTQLTMRTFHTGGVFSGDISDQIRMPFTGIVNFMSPIPGTLIRTPEGKIAFLTKSNGSFSISNLTGTEKKKYKIPEYTLLFGRHGEIVVEKEVVAQISSISKQKNATDDAELTIKSEIEGQFYLQHLQLKETKVGPKQKEKEGDIFLTPLESKLSVDQKGQHLENQQFQATDNLKSSPMDSIFSAWNWGNAWILSGKVYHSSFPSHFFPKIGDYINRQSSIVISKGNSSFCNVSGFIKLERPNRLYPKYSIPSRLTLLKKSPLGAKFGQSGTPESQNSYNQPYSLKNNFPIYNFEFLSFPLSSIIYKKIGYFAKINTPLVSSFGKKKSLKKTSGGLKINKFGVKSSYYGLLNSNDSLFIIPPNAQVRFTRNAFVNKSLVNLSPSNWQPNFNVVLQWFPSFFRTKTSGILKLEEIKENQMLSQEKKYIPSLQVKKTKKMNSLDSISTLKNPFIKEKLMCLTKSQIFINLKLTKKNEKNISFINRNTHKVENNQLAKEKNTVRGVSGTKTLLSQSKASGLALDNSHFSRLFFIGQNQQPKAPFNPTVLSRAPAPLKNRHNSSSDLNLPSLEKEKALLSNSQLNNLLSQLKTKKSAVLKETSNVLDSTNKSKNQSIGFFNNKYSYQRTMRLYWQSQNMSAVTTFGITTIKTFKSFLTKQRKKKSVFLRTFGSNIDSGLLNFICLFCLSGTPVISKWGLSVALQATLLSKASFKCGLATLLSNASVRYLALNNSPTYPLKKEPLTKKNQWIYLISLSGAPVPLKNKENESQFLNLNEVSLSVARPHLIKCGKATLLSNASVRYLALEKRTMHASLGKKIFYPGQAINSELLFDQHIVNVEPLFIRVNNFPSSFEFQKKSLIVENWVFNTKCRYKGLRSQSEASAPLKEGTKENFQIAFNIKKVDEFFLNSLNTKESLNIKSEIYQLCQFYENPINSLSTLWAKSKCFNNQKLKPSQLKNSHLDFNLGKPNRSTLINLNSLKGGSPPLSRHLSAVTIPLSSKNSKALFKLFFNKTLFSLNEIQKLKNSFFNKQKLSPQLMSKYPSVDIDIISNFSNCLKSKHLEKSKEFHLFSFFVTLPSFRSIFDKKTMNPPKTILSQPNANSLDLTHDKLSKLSFNHKLKDSSYPFKEYKFDFSAPIISYNSVAKLYGNKAASNLSPMRNSPYFGIKGSLSGLFCQRQNLSGAPAPLKKNKITTKHFLKNALINQNFTLLNTLSLFKSPFLSTSLIHKLEPSFSSERNSTLFKREGKNSFIPVNVKFKVNQFVSGQYFSSLIPFAKTYLYSPFEGEVLDITSPSYSKKNLLGKQNKEGLTKFAFKNHFNSFSTKNKFSELIQKESTFLQIKQHTSIILTKGDLVSFYFPISNLKPTSYAEFQKLTQSYIVKDGLFSLTPEFLKNEETRITVSTRENVNEKSQLRELENFHIYKLPQIVSGFVGLKKTKTSTKKRILTKKTLLSRSKQNSLSFSGIKTKKLNLSGAPDPLKGLLKKENQNHKNQRSVLAFLLGDFIVSGDSLILNSTLSNNEINSLNKEQENKVRSAVTNSGQIIHLNKEKITIRKGQPLFVSPKAILHKFDGDFIDPKSPVITLSYQRLKTGDIVQGIPKIEQFFEARTTKRGRLFRDSLPNLLKALFKRYLQKLPLDKAVRQSFYKIQQIIVDGVLRVYRSQGVTIADKHLEIIVKQMTSKVRILEGGQTGFFPGEIVDLDFVEQVNQLLMKKIQYEPLVLGITKSSLEVDSFLSAASFQQTTRVLSGAAIARKKDFLKGLKENVILGNLIPAGTGYLVFLNDTSSNSILAKCN